MNIPLSDFKRISLKTDAAEYLAQLIKQRGIKTVGVWGPSGSGKTTFARALYEAVGRETSLILEVENYWQYTQAQMAERGLTGYHWETRDKARFLADLQRLQKGESIKRPVFDTIREAPAERTAKVMPKDIIILEDTLDFSDIAELGVFMYAPDEVLIERRIARDAHKTGFKDLAELRAYLEAKSLPAYREKLLPSMTKAHYVIDTSESALHENTRV